MSNLAVIFGGQTAEHSISIMTALDVMKNLSAKNNIIPIYIDTKGNWWTGEHLSNIEEYKVEPTGKKCFFVPNEQCLMIKTGILNKKINIDCAVLALHGGMYEGGAVQSVLQLSHIPYTSPSLIGSGICMDKVISKLIFKSLSVLTPNFVWDSIDNKDLLCSNATSKLNFPLIVKPARSGSSVGITKVDNVEDLEQAIDYASLFDDKILVEEYLDGFREINIALIKDKDEIKFSTIEEVKVAHDIYSFDDKYSQNSTSERIIPADLGLKIRDRIYNISQKVYNTLELSGVVRFDFFVVENKVFLNEINTIPGNFAAYLWRKEGITFGHLLNIAIRNACSKKENLGPAVFDPKIIMSFDNVKGKK